MLCTETVDYFGAARDNVSDNSTAGGGREFREHLRWKPMRVSGKGLRNMNARNFPVSSCAVFPGGGGVHQSPCANGRTSRIRALERRNVSETARRHRGKIEASDGGRDVTECIAAGVTVRLGIGSRTGTDSIEDDYRCALQLILRNSTDRVGREAP